jgi:hypothetical protein
MSEFAEYTNAQERVGLSKKAKKLEAIKKREQMQVAIEEAFVSLLHVSHPALIIVLDAKTTKKRWNGNKSSYAEVVEVALLTLKFMSNLSISPPLVRYIC